MGSTLLLSGLLLFATPLEDAREHLANCRLKQAASSGELARNRADSSRDALLLLAAVYDATRDDKRARSVYAALKNLPPAPETPADKVEEPADIRPGEVRYVSATRVRLRQGADASSALVAELTVNDTVTVKSFRSGWIDATVTHGDTELAGHLRASLTSVRKVDDHELLQDARKDARAGNWLAAFRKLDLVAEARPNDEDVRRELLRAAVNAGQFKRAAATCERQGRMGVYNQLKDSSSKCRHWRGEEPYDDKRANFLAEQATRDCGRCEKDRDAARKAGWTEEELVGLACDD